MLPINQFRKRCRPSIAGVLVVGVTEYFFRRTVVVIVWSSCLTVYTHTHTHYTFPCWNKIRTIPPSIDADKLRQHRSCTIRFHRVDNTKDHRPPFCVLGRWNSNTSHGTLSIEFVMN